MIAYWTESDSQEEKMGKSINELNDILFDQLQRLNSEGMKEEELEKEIKRSKAITDVAKNIIENADLALRASIAQDNKLSWQSSQSLPPMLTGGTEKDEKKAAK